MKGAEQTGRIRQNRRKRLITAAHGSEAFWFKHTLFVYFVHCSRPFKPEKNLLAFLSTFWDPS